MCKTRKRIPVLFLALALVLSMAASAAPRYAVTSRCEPKLSITGTTAQCGLRVTAQKGSSITGTLTLYRGSTPIKTWDIDETTSVSFSDTYTVTKGYTYKLVADLTVSGTGGTDKVSEYVTKTYS